MLISFDLPQLGSALFVLRGRIRSYTKSDLRDLQYLDFGLDCYWLFSQQNAWSVNRPSCLCVHFLRAIYVCACSTFNA